MRIVWLGGYVTRRWTRASPRDVNMQRPVIERSWRCVSISVLIATHNRAQLLEPTLECLGMQSFQPGDEVIVVDNASTDATSRGNRADGDTIPCAVARSIRIPRREKPRPLTPHAREAQGEILALTDDDVLVG